MRCSRVLDTVCGRPPGVRVDGRPHALSARTGRRRHVAGPAGPSRRPGARRTIPSTHTRASCIFSRPAVQARRWSASTMSIWPIRCQQVGCSSSARRLSASAVHLVLTTQTRRAGAPDTDPLVLNPSTRRFTMNRLDVESTSAMMTVALRCEPHSAGRRYRPPDHGRQPAVDRSHAHRARRAPRCGNGAQRAADRSRRHRRWWLVRCSPGCRRCRTAPWTCSRR